MNYFQLYGIEQGFFPDPAEVKKKFYELSRKYHPDRFSMAEDATKAEALRMAALNNDAYKTLSDPYKTMAYILRSHGLLEDEEKYNLPPEFLMDMMELNEAISEYQIEPDEGKRKQAWGSWQEQMEQWDRSVVPLLKKFDPKNIEKAVLQQIKDYYFRKKYLLRIQERIDRFAAR